MVGWLRCALHTCTVTMFHKGTGLITVLQKYSICFKLSSSGISCSFISSLAFSSPVRSPLLSGIPTLHLMDSHRQEIGKTLSRIDGLDLPHPSSALLSAFVSEALQPVVAARYVNNRLSAGEASSLVSDWIYIIESGELFPSTAGRPQASQSRKAVA